MSCELNLRELIAENKRLITENPNELALQVNLMSLEAHEKDSSQSSLVTGWPGTDFWINPPTIARDIHPASRS